MASRSLPDSTDPSRVTTFDMECPVALPISEADAARLLWSLVQFTALHEAAEFLRRDDRPVFDPHDPALEPVIYGTPTIWWSEADA